MKFLWTFLAGIGLVFGGRGLCTAQNLADAARQEQQSKAQKKKANRVFTNDDLGTSAGGSVAEASTSGTRTTTGSATTAEPRENAQSTPLKDDPERSWSKKFIEAKTKLKTLQDEGTTLQNQLNETNLKLMRQGDVYDREHLYPSMIAKFKTDLEKNKEDVKNAEQALEDLREELRKTGNPISWENSQKALEPESEKTTTPAPAKKDQKYWQAQIAEVNKKYDEQIRSLQQQRFLLVNRRPAAENEPLDTPSNLGMGAPPRVFEIDAQIKELNQKRDQELAALTEKAIQEGAMPGWFR